LRARRPLCTSATTRQLVEANVPAYAKIIDVSQAKSELTREQVQKVADLLRGAPGLHEARAWLERARHGLPERLAG